jgi:AmiR/NasT family two-component response regulator
VTRRSEVVEATPTRLRVLIADGTAERLGHVTSAVRLLGHELVGAGSSLEDVGQATATELPDVALVIVGEESERALDVIRTIVREAACPVIAILDVQDRRFIDRAARLGIFSHLVHVDDPEEMQSAMDISLQRFAEYHALEGAFGRRAVTERAKGILMERHGIDEQRAFQLIREEARHSNTKMVDIAASILASHRLLSSGATAPVPREG